MKIVNYSDILRKNAIKTFEDYLDLNDLECSFEYFKKFCTNYKTYIEVMLICSYLRSNFDNFLYDDNEYEPTDTVKNNSAQIINDTGFHQGEGY